MRTTKSVWCDEAPNQKDPQPWPWPLNEHEVILPPYTPLCLTQRYNERVGGTDQEVTVIKVDVLDGKENEEWYAELSVKPVPCIPI